MTPEYVAIQQNWTVAEVLEHLRKVGRDRESLNQLYVVDERGHLVNWVRLRNVVVDRGVEIPDGLVIGEDPHIDAQRFRRTDSGVCLVTRPMIDNLVT